MIQMELPGRSKVFARRLRPSHQIQETHHPQPLRFMQRFFHGFGKARLLKLQRGFGKLWKAGDFWGMKYSDDLYLGIITLW